MKLAVFAILRGRIKTKDVSGRNLFCDRAEEWAEIQKVRNQERREQLEQQAAKRAECNRQANEQKLRLRERRAFIKKCTGT